MNMKKAFFISLISKLIGQKETVSFNEYILIYLFYIDKSGLFNKKLCLKLITILFGLDQRNFISKKELELLLQKVIMEDKIKNSKLNLTQLFNDDIYTLDQNGKRISKFKLVKFLYNNPQFIEYLIKIILY